MDEFEANPTESPPQRLTWYRAADSRSLESDEKIAGVAAPAKMEVAAAPPRLRQGKGAGTRPAPRPPERRVDPVFGGRRVVAPRGRVLVGAGLGTGFMERQDVWRRAWWELWRQRRWLVPFSWVSGHQTTRDPAGFSDPPRGPCPLSWIRVGEMDRVGGSRCANMHPLDNGSVIVVACFVVLVA